LSFLYNDCVRIRRRGNTDTDPYGYSYSYANFNPKAHSYAPGYSNTKTSPDSASSPDAVTPE
jgi:hypothetical protein